MKQCPVCKSSYTDDSLSFCLSDGAALIMSAPSSNSEITQQMSFSSSPTIENNPPIRVNIQSETPTQLSIPKNTIQTGHKRSSSTIIFIVIGILVVFGIGGIAFAYFAFIKPDNTIAVNSTPTPAKTLTPLQNNTPDETQALKEKLEKLEKQLNEQKSSKNNSAVPAIPTTTATTPVTVTARVNSPGDGFLALRTMPNAKTGDQILQIPHGATVNVLGCQGVTNVGDRKGRWCRVSYDNQQGWSFDAFLIY